MGLRPKSHGSRKSSSLADSRASMRVMCKTIRQWRSVAARLTAQRPCHGLCGALELSRARHLSSIAGNTDLPIVNVAGLRDMSAERLHQRREIGEQLVAAASEIGFFYVSEHGVPECLLTEARDVSRHFFDLPTDVKEKLSIRDEPSRRGYQFVGENITQGKPDQHEAFDMYRDMPATTAAQSLAPTNHGTNRWPLELPDMQHFFEDRYVPAMHDLGDALMRGIALGLSLDERHFEPYFTSSFWIMRLIRYPPTPGSAEPAAERMGCGTHTDYGILTMLNQDPDPSHAECLQAQMRDGRWVAVPPLSGALAVNIGDMLALWTGGRLRATPHRVSSPRSSARVAVPFFFEPNYNAEIAPLQLSPPRLADPFGSEVQAFAPIKYGDHLLGKVATNFDL